jgi:hypothetical protein
MRLFRSAVSQQTRTPFIEAALSAFGEVVALPIERTSHQHADTYRYWRAAELARELALPFLVNPPHATIELGAERLLAELKALSSTPQTTAIATYLSGLLDQVDEGHDDQGAAFGAGLLDLRTAGLISNNEIQTLFADLCTLDMVAFETQRELDDRDTLNRLTPAELNSFYESF